MTADRRNTRIVFALVVSMTVGVVVLLLLEARLVPEKQDFSGSTLLMATQGLRVAQVEVSYVAPPVGEDTIPAVRAAFDPGDSVCWIPADGGAAPLESRGPLVRMVVLGSEAETLNDEQKKTLLGALASLSQLSGLDLVPVRLAPDSDARHNSTLPPQAADLREFLKRKGIITDSIT